mmetsp:Transcript_4880/g.9500  ORF Transcript_4880/g.9500 Transcript_4880/m.9500 type:complete len:203 (+) Transcript_4880:2787-3395(+)
MLIRLLILVTLSGYCSTPFRRTLYGANLLPPSGEILLLFVLRRRRHDDQRRRNYNSPRILGLEPSIGEWTGFHLRLLGRTSRSFFLFWRRCRFGGGRVRCVFIVRRIHRIFIRGSIGRSGCCSPRWLLIICCIFRHRLGSITAGSYHIFGIFAGNFVISFAFVLLLILSSRIIAVALFLLLLFWQLSKRPNTPPRPLLHQTQ